MTFPWRVCGASATGSSHEAEGTPCQDTHDWIALGTDHLAIAVADGAGTASHGYQGATCATAASLEHLKSIPPDDLQIQHLIAAVGQARHQVEDQAKTSGTPLRDYACTLILVVISGSKAMVCQVGDGAVVAQTTDHHWLALTHPMVGEFANETVFLTCIDAEEEIQACTHEFSCTHLAVFSDGLERLALNLPECIPYPPFFRPLFSFQGSQADQAVASRELAKLLTSDRIRQRTDDDITLVLATRQPVAGE